jgi:hypothetical protein
MASLPFNFAQGRYDSARTMIAIWMLLLGLIYVMERFRITRGSHESGAPNTLFVLKSVTVAILCINLTASAIFLHDWHKAFQAFSSVVNAHPGNTKIEIVSGDQRRTLLGPIGSGLNERMGFSWTWPYRSIVAAKSFRPDRVIMDREEALAQCKALSLRTNASRIPAEVMDAVSGFACAQPAPPDRRFFRQWLFNFWKPTASRAPNRSD